MSKKDIVILGIESSCDDTSAAIIRNGFVLSNKVANQDVHKKYGGVVPELASRAHQKNIIPVVDVAIKEAGLRPEDISAVAFTRGPGLMGALLVGTSFAKGFAMSNNIPMIDVNHLHAHILSVFLQQENENKPLPPFPFLCLLVSGGHTQILIVKNHLESEIIGQTIDDAAGEAFDKCAKVMGLPYPGGPLVDKYAKEGNAHAIEFNKPRIEKLDYSFSGLKTSFLYFLRDQVKVNENYIEENKRDICASLQKTIIEILFDKLIIAAKQTEIKHVAIAGGVSANSGLRNELLKQGEKHNWNVYIPEFKYSTDNAAMIAIAGYYKYLNKEFAGLAAAPYARNKV
ncbi:MAG: tRNA (adenosine(37)-N6)-threonylcarbamoyltransferase complex transferase subunit TsaD [Bacteroidales bacterium]|nr:tRNA (adenosine(37)-N6)-threonylcarbamoyltransferase complex transferase subunit TsaD [Bacteroidales bacterium]MBN2821511.1 tRNA (adenosine(37)-N6)-threonylcarbamoyltransferase complex transferase subunit TsaD [Bacteroidales bacterium]